MHVYKVSYRVVRKFTVLVSTHNLTSSKLSRKLIHYNRELNMDIFHLCSAGMFIF